MLLDVVEVMVKSGGSGFWRGNPPTDLKGLGYVGATCRRPSDWSVRWWPVGFGWVQRVGLVMRTRGHP